MAQLYIARLNGSDDAKVVRIDVKDGRTLLSRTEVSLEDFAAALMGQGAVPAWFSTQRDAPGARLPRDADK